MEFTISCPIDGTITVSLEDIDQVVLREPEHADITFVCPHCGSTITVEAVVPSFLLAAMEALADEIEPGESLEITWGGRDQGLEVAAELDIDDPRVDAYCEYFRRQLSTVDCVEDALSQMDVAT